MPGAAGLPEPFAGGRAALPTRSSLIPPTPSTPGAPGPPDAAPAAATAAGSYQVLARKSRPQDFSSLVGQEPIVRALRNALAEGRIAQAYLFSGIRGVGKTSAARVLAKALNCERGPAPDPCNDCQICREITSGADLDVLEVDAATYSKVEQVRDLTESLKYGPTRDRYKVVVLDEVHRLSRQAFDALLKIVEEPPPRVLFIFATTESDAVPATILSRCQEFNFRRVPTPVLAAHLAELCVREGITASAAALRLVARAGEGSVRDSVALLDQLATYGRGVVGDDDAARLLGTVDAELFHRLLTAMLAGDGAAVSAQVAELDDGGADPRHVFAQYLAYLRDGLHLAQGVAVAAVDLPGDEAERLAALARPAGARTLMRLLGQLLAGETTVRRSESGLLAVEIAWLRAAELPQLLAIESLIAGVASGAALPVQATAPAASASAPRPAAPAPPPRPQPPPPSRSATPAPRPTAPPAAPPRAAPAVAPPATQHVHGDAVQRLLEAISRVRQPLAGYLEECHTIELVGTELVIAAEPKDPCRQALDREANRKVLEDALRDVIGPGTTWRLTDATPRAAAATVATTERSQPEQAATQHPTVQAVLDIFSGEVTTVEPVARDPEDA